MSNEKWTNTYDLKVDMRHFHVSVFQDRDGFHASCLWYEKGRLLKVPGQTGSLTLQLEQRCAASESEAVAQIIQWAKEKFGDSLVGVTTEIGK